MEYVLASRNRRKIAELEAILRGFASDRGKFRLLSLDDIGVTEDIAESGATFEENAILKASVAASKGYWGIADDSGLCVDALTGTGIWSARFCRPKTASTADSARRQKTTCCFCKSVNAYRSNSAPQSFVCVIAVCPPSATPTRLRWAASARA